MVLLRHTLSGDVSGGRVGGGKGLSQVHRQVEEERRGACHERKHGLSTEQFPVSAYVGSSKNLKDILPRQGCVVVLGLITSQ